MIEVTVQNSPDPPSLLISGDAYIVKQIKDIWDDTVCCAYNEHTFRVSLLTQEYPAETYDAHAGILDGEEYLKVIKHQRIHHRRIKFPHLDPRCVMRAGLMLPTRPWEEPRNPVQGNRLPKSYPTTIFTPGTEENNEWANRRPYDTRENTPGLSRSDPGSASDIQRQGYPYPGLLPSRSEGTHLGLNIEGNIACERLFRPAAHAISLLDYLGTCYEAARRSEHAEDKEILAPVRPRKLHLLVPNITLRNVPTFEAPVNRHIHQSARMCSVARMSALTPYR